MNDTGSDNTTVAELIDNIYEEVAQLVDKYRERFRGSHNTTTDSEDLSAARVCYTDECGEPCRSYVESLRAERDAARKAAGVAGERLGKERAKVARAKALADEWELRAQLTKDAAATRVGSSARSSLRQYAAVMSNRADDLRAALSEGDTKSAHINDTSAGRCTAALIVKGETFLCDLAAEHVGWAHSNQAAEAVWNGGEPR